MLFLWLHLHFSDPLTSGPVRPTRHGIRKMANDIYNLIYFFTALYKIRTITLSERSAIFEDMKKLKSVVKRWTTYGRNQQNTAEIIINGLIDRYA